MRTTKKRLGLIGALIGVVVVSMALVPATARPRSAPPAAQWPKGQHPWPSGDEWPKGLNGPFAAAPMEKVEITMSDGVKVRGTLHRPALPATVRPPVVIWSSPYFGNLDATSDDTDGAAARPLPVPVDRLVQEGVAVLSVSVRGTGPSGGCLELYGRRVQADQAELVDWAGAQSWANGRVAMMGMSHDGFTAVAAAIQNRPALKTIIAIAPLTDYYLSNATPQGAMNASMSAGTPPAHLIVQGPPVHRDPTELDAALEGSSDISEHVCDNTVDENVTGVTSIGSERDGEYFNARRLTDGFPNVTAAVLLTHSFKDTTVQAYSSNAIAWETLTKAPKAFIFDQMDHCYPSAPDWTDRVVRWMNFWLKGVGSPPPELGTVDYQVAEVAAGNCVQGIKGQGPRRMTTSWPPADARVERMYVSGNDLSTEYRGPGGHAFVAAPRVGSQAPCETPGNDGVTDVTKALFTTDVLTETVQIAGNPVAHLDLMANDTAGIVDVRLWALGPTSCDPVMARLLGTGSADLRFLHGNFTAEPFPSQYQENRATRVRVDLPALAETVRAGERLALVIGGPEASERVPTATPLIVVNGSSELHLPLVEGTLGGTVPDGTYEPRPFMPAAA